MKRSLYLLLVVTGMSYGQGEFTTYPNGLIYNESTMTRLGVIIDSLNLRFRSCDLAHPYYSVPQGMAHFVEVSSRAQREAIRSGISFEEFDKRFPNCVRQRGLWIVKSHDVDYTGKKLVSYEGLPAGWGSQRITVNERPGNDKSTGWVLSDDGKEAVYLSGISKPELPHEYARMVQYVDCMIDTTSEIYFPTAGRGYFSRKETEVKASRFIEWAERFPGKPPAPDYESDSEALREKYIKEFEAWDSARLHSLEAELQKHPYWKNLLDEAAEEAFRDGTSDEKLEIYVERFLSPERALELKRNRRVMGFCSMDTRPREHAMEICVLAAKTTKWDIFLRSHLDIMNDRFERMSDGSYAWEGRKTYLKELEKLDIHAVDLLLGTVLRVENVSKNHYWGSINRVGRALANVENKDDLEYRLSAILLDERLDMYNRLLIAYLFNHYAANLDEPRRTSTLLKVDALVATMPESVRSVWKNE